MRQSVAPNRQISHPSPTALARLLEKKKEFYAVSALEKASALYLERMEGLKDDCEIMANAGEVHGQVLAQWPKMFQILSQFLSARDSFDADSNGASLPSEEGQRLIRIPIDELRQANTDKE